MNRIKSLLLPLRQPTQVNAAEFSARVSSARFLNGRRLAAIGLVTLSLCSSTMAQPADEPAETATAVAEGVDTDRDAVLNRVDTELQYLTSDELEGRGVETDGIHEASEYIREEFREAGLTSGVEDGSYYQPFPITLGESLAIDKCTLQLQGPNQQTIEFEVESDFVPQLVGGDGEATGELVFVGYGINAQDLEFQEYEDVDVEGKIVVMMRHEPNQKDEESRFNGTDPSSHAYIMTKVTAAKLQRAAAVLFVNDPLAHPDADSDELAPPGQFGRRSLGVPFFHVKQAKVNELLKLAPVEDAEGNSLDNLADVQAQIDSTLQPLSQPIKGWTAKLGSEFETETVEAYNVVGVVEGEGPHADETIVVGGHYDHLGYGGYGSRAPGRNEIHYGADDNATGTVAVLELARRFAAAEQKPARRIVFIAFSGEERGLIGSRYYVENPLFPLEQTVAMVNFDMIGRLRNNQLTVFGATSSDVFDGLIEAAAEGTDLELNVPRSGFGGSDHLPFYQKQIPDVFIHTGLHDVYHTPEDSYETINVPGMVDVIDFSERLIDALADLPERPTFSSGESRPRRRAASYLGAAPDFGSSDEGIYIRAVTDDSPAEQAGIKVGDVIVSMAGKATTDQNSLLAVLQDNEPGEEVKVVLLRDGEEVELTVKLGENPRR